MLRYLGKGVTKAVENINKEIGPALTVRPSKIPDSPCIRCEQ